LACVGLDLFRACLAGFEAHGKLGSSSSRGPPYPRAPFAGGVARVGRQAPRSKLPIRHPNRYPAEVL